MWTKLLTTCHRNTTEEMCGNCSSEILIFKNPNSLFHLWIKHTFSKEVLRQAQTVLTVHHINWPLFYERGVLLHLHNWFEPHWNDAFNTTVSWALRWTDTSSCWRTIKIHTCNQGVWKNLDLVHYTTKRETRGRFLIASFLYFILPWCFIAYQQYEQFKSHMWSHGEKKKAGSKFKFLILPMGIKTWLGKLPYNHNTLLSKLHNTHIYLSELAGGFTTPLYRGTKLPCFNEISEALRFEQGAILVCCSKHHCLDWQDAKTGRRGAPTSASVITIKHKIGTYSAEINCISSILKKQRRQHVNCLSVVWVPFPSPCRF